MQQSEYAMCRGPEDYTHYGTLLDGDYVDDMGKWYTNPLQVSMESEPRSTNTDVHGQSPGFSAVHANISEPKEDGLNAIFLSQSDKEQMMRACFDDVV